MRRGGAPQTSLPRALRFVGALFLSSRVRPSTRGSTNLPLPPHPRPPIMVAERPARIFGPAQIGHTDAPHQTAAP